MATTAAKKRAFSGTFATALAVLLAAGAAEASRFTPTAASGLAQEQGLYSLSSLPRAGDLAAALPFEPTFRFPLFIDQSHAVGDVDTDLVPTNPRPAAFRLFPGLASAPASPTPRSGKLASGLESWEPQLNVQRVQQLAAVSWWSHEKLGAVDSVNLYSFVAMQPTMARDPLGLLGPNTDVNYDPSVLTMLERQRAVDYAASELRRACEEAEYQANLAAFHEATRLRQEQCRAYGCWAAAPTFEEWQAGQRQVAAYDESVRRAMLPAVCLVEIPNELTGMFAGAGARAPGHTVMARRAPKRSPSARPVTPPFREAPEQLIQPSRSAAKPEPAWKAYERRHGGVQTPMTTTFRGQEVRVRLDKPPSGSLIVDFKAYNWANERYSEPFIQGRVVTEFTKQIQKYLTIRPHVHFQFSQQPPGWVVAAIETAGGTYSVVP